MTVQALPRARTVHPLAAQLTDLRKASGRDRADVAGQADVRTHRLHQWENGTTYPTLQNLHRWAAALGVRVAARPVGGAPLPGDPVRALALYRVACRLTQEQVALASGTFTQSLIASWERGARTPGPFSLSAWAAALGCDLALVPAAAEAA
jgi:transcriptional regulator with XRE-family HTH domain